MTITYKKASYSVQLIKKVTTSEGVVIYLFKNLFSLTVRPYIVACQSLGTTVAFEFFKDIQKACNNYLELICRYA